MPVLANITIKKFNGTTDVIYTAVAGASGDNSPAVFRNGTEGTTLAENPTFLISSKANGPKTGRRINVEFSWPTKTVDASGNVTITGRAAGSATLLVPQNQTVATINEMGSQFGNLLGATLTKACFVEGYAPRG
jgi:hypothetical protein